MSNVKQNIQGNGNCTVGQAGGKTTIKGKVVQNVKGNNNQTVGEAPGDVTL